MIIMYSYLGTMIFLVGISLNPSMSNCGWGLRQSPPFFVFLVFCFVVVVAFLFVWVVVLKLYTLPKIVDHRVTTT